jgi:hypothetical protein
MRLSLPVTLTAVLLWLPAPAGAAAERPPTLEHALVRHAGGMIDRLQEAGCKAVGVLPFEAVDEAGKALPGTMGFGVAREVEVALVLRNNFRRPLGILRDAGATAGKVPGASHRSPGGVKKLFAASYTLAWGSRTAQADAFVTGRVRASKDRRTLTIAIRAILRGGESPLALGTVSARTTPDDLAEMGKSFNVRELGAFDFDTPGSGGLSGKAPPKAVPPKEEKGIVPAAGKHPLEQASTPVGLEVYYGDTKQEVTFRDGDASVPPPEPGQKVRLVLKRHRGSARYGLVVKVNGRSTYQKEEAKDELCRRWVLQPGEERLGINGFQINGETAEELVAVSPKELARRASEYDPSRLGLISVAIFEEGPPARPDGEPLVEDDAGARERAVGTRALPPKKASAQALAQSLREPGESDTREAGILPGKEIRSEVRQVPFRNPRHVITYVVRYYSPR